MRCSPYSAPGAARSKHETGGQTIRIIILKSSLQTGHGLSDVYNLIPTLTAVTSRTTNEEGASFMTQRTTLPTTDRASSAVRCPSITSVWWAHYHEAYSKCAAPCCLRPYVRVLNFRRTSACHQRRLLRAAPFHRLFPTSIGCRRWRRWRVHGSFEALGSSLFRVSTISVRFCLSVHGLSATESGSRTSAWKSRVYLENGMRVVLYCWPSAPCENISKIYDHRPSLAAERRKYHIPPHGETRIHPLAPSTTISPEAQIPNDHAPVI